MTVAIVFTSFPQQGHLKKTGASMTSPSFGSGEEAGKERIGVEGSPPQAILKSCRLSGGALRMGFRFVHGFIPGTEG
jgi:hypothetical protein